MKKIFILIAILLTALRVEAQTVEFMRLYNTALDSFDRHDNPTEQDAKATKESTETDADKMLVTSEFSGRMLQSIMPRKATDKNHMINRIEMIRQIKFPPAETSELFDKVRALAQSDLYERLSIMNVGEQAVYIYTTPYKHRQSEFLILIVKGDTRLVCDIVGEVTMKDVIDLIFGRA